MILIINESNAECKGFRQKLSPHFESQCLCYDYITAKRLREIAPRVILMARGKDDEKILRTLKTVHKALPGTLVFFYDDSGAGIPPDTRFPVTLLASDFGSLIDGIRQFEADNVEWKKRICEVERYIKENIKNIHTAGDIPRELHFESRIFTNEFKYRTGKNLREYMNAVRLELVTKILHDAPLNGANYYAIALRCGFKSDSSLATFIQRQTGMNLGKFHSYVLQK